MTPPVSLRQALSRLSALPAVPRIAQEILSLKINSDEGERVLLGLVAREPAILSKIIGMANSPLYATGRNIVTLQDAAVLLGSKRIKMVALSFAMMSSMSRKQQGLLNMQNLWRHSLAVAMTMEVLSRYMPEELRPSEDEIYLAGLLHDIGFLVLDQIDGQLSDQFHARLAAESGCSVREVEAKMLEMNHCELGAELGRHWNLPEAILIVLSYHHTPEDARAAAGWPLVAMANLAEKILPAFGIAEPESSEIGAKEWQALGIDPALEDRVMAVVGKNVREVMDIEL